MTQPNILQHKDSPMKSLSSFNRYMNGEDEDYDGYEIKIDKYQNQYIDEPVKYDTILVDRCKSDRELLFEFMKGYERLKIENARLEYEVKDYIRQGLELAEDKRKAEAKYDFLFHHSKAKCDDMDNTCGTAIKLLERILSEKDKEVAKLNEKLELSLSM